MYLERCSVHVEAAGAIIRYARDNNTSHRISRRIVLHYINVTSDNVRMHYHLRSLSRRSIS